MTDLIARYIFEDEVSLDELPAYVIGRTSRGRVAVSLRTRMVRRLEEIVLRDCDPAF
jgi:hypothetical protein